MHGARPCQPATLARTSEDKPNKGGKRVKYNKCKIRPCQCMMGRIVSPVFTCISCLTACVRDSDDENIPASRGDNRSLSSFESAILSRGTSGFSVWNILSDLGWGRRTDFTQKYCRSFDYRVGWMNLQKNSYTCACCPLPKNIWKLHWKCVNSTGLYIF